MKIEERRIKRDGIVLFLFYFSFSFIFFSSFFMYGKFVSLFLLENIVNSEFQIKDVGCVWHIELVVENIHMHIIIIYQKKRISSCKK